MPTNNQKLRDWEKSFLSSEVAQKILNPTQRQWVILEIRSLLEAREEALKQREEEIVNHRDTQILAWFNIPIKTARAGEIGPIACDMCGSHLFNIRGRHPKQPNRAVCPTCAIEILEKIESNLYPNNQASQITIIKETTK